MVNKNGRLMCRAPVFENAEKLLCAKLYQKEIQNRKRLKKVCVKIKQKKSKNLKKFEVLNLNMRRYRLK